MDISTTFKSGLNSKTTLGGLWWTINPLQGIQKVRGSNPLGSTRFLTRNCPAAWTQRTPRPRNDTLLGLLLPKAPSEVGGDERGAQKVGNRPTSMVEAAARREPKHYQRRRLVAAQNRPP